MLKQNNINDLINAIDKDEIKKYIDLKIGMIISHLEKKDINAAHEVCVSMLDSDEFNKGELFPYKAYIYYLLGHIYEKYHIYESFHGPGSAQAYYKKASELFDKEHDPPELEVKIKESIAHLEKIMINKIRGDPKNSGDQKSSKDTHAESDFYHRKTSILKKQSFSLSAKPNLSLIKSNLSIFTKNKNAQKKLRILVTTFENLRKIYIDSIEAGQPVHEVNTLYAKQLKSILRGMLKNISILIGKAPCHFDIIVFGSMVRADMGPYSDVDCAILIENEKYHGHEYFKKLIDLFGFYLRQMCGRWIMNEKSIHYVGLHLDDGDVQQLTHEMGNLQQDPNTLANWVVSPIFKDYDINWAYQHALLRSTCIYSNTKGELWRTYQTDLMNMLELSYDDINQTSNASGYQLLGLEALERDTNDFLLDHSVKGYDQRSIVNIKKDFLNPITCWCMNIATYFNLKKNNDTELLSDINEIIDQLDKLSLFDSHWLDQLKSTISILQDMRVRYQIIRMGQPDTVRVPNEYCADFSMDDSIPLLSVNDINILQDIKQCILTPLYKSVNLWIENPHKHQHFHPVEEYYNYMLKEYENNRITDKDYKETELMLSSYKNFLQSDKRVQFSDSGMGHG